MNLKQRARHLKNQTSIVYFASRDPRMPWHVKLVAIAIIAYALSPIDLIPDFIPILGLLDDIIIVPLGLALIIKLTPAEIMADAKIKAQQAEAAPKNYVTASIFIFIWLAVIYVAGHWIYHAYVI